MQKRPVAIAVVCVGTALIAALPSDGKQFDSQHPDASLRHTVDRYIEANSANILAEFRALLRIPNVSADTPNIRKNATFLKDRLAARGFATELLETDGNPLVYGELRSSRQGKTVLFYFQYDGQPVDPRAWRQADPFEPVLREGRVEDGAAERIDWAGAPAQTGPWRIYARSAADAKGPIIAFLAALDALRASGLTTGCNLRVIMDGDEERGSPDLVPAIARYREKLKADLMLVMDGPLHPSGRPTLLLGARGILPLELTVFGPLTGAHSGNYGNWIPNPALRLAHLLASMKDDRGVVTIRSFYDLVQPLSPEEQEIVNSVPDEPDRLKSAFGIAEAERAGESIQASLQRPALNINGLASAVVGPESRTIIPDRAVASLDVRLIRETPPEVMHRLVREHILQRGYLLVDREPLAHERSQRSRIARLEAGQSMPAFRTSPSNPHVARIAATLTRIWGDPPIRIRTAGGTVPIAPFIDTLGVPAVIVPIVNFDNNQHAENENVQLATFYRGIVTIAAILRTL